MSDNRLGKGLEALIRPEKEMKKKRSVKGSKIASGVTEIAIKEIRPNPNQPRREFDQLALEELASSIMLKGVVTPITVRTVESGYEIIAGERRWRASKISRKKKIPAYVINVKNDAELMEISLIENIQREDLNALEESEAYAVLNSKFDMTHGEIAKAVGKKRVTISNSLRLLKLPIEIRKSLREGLISAGHARAILQGKTVSEMIKAWKMILKNDLNVRATEALFKKPVRSAKKKKSKSSSPQVLAIENQLIEVFGTKVKLRAGKDGGSIEISYYSNDDLDRIIDLIDSIS
ncbi:MAG: ParB/RepB/Spo0J family partition protein [Candidatus Marinimicrobia bacterium]|nr:ParB/RepB/Spo0J family partition protein [Candidatus Neomarinimicrobiota bacterium]